LGEVGRGTGVAGVAERGFSRAESTLLRSVACSVKRQVWHSGEAGNGLGVLVVDSMVLESISGAVRCLSGARVAESGPVAAVGACQVLSPLLKRRAREQARLVWPGSGTGGCWLWIIWCWGVLLKL